MFAWLSTVTYRTLLREKYKEPSLTKKCRVLGQHPSFVDGLSEIVNINPGCRAQIVKIFVKSQIAKIFVKS